MINRKLRDKVKDCYVTAIFAESDGGSTVMGGIKWETTADRCHLRTLIYPFSRRMLSQNGLDTVIVCKDKDIEKLLQGKKNTEERSKKD